MYCSRALDHLPVRLSDQHFNPVTDAMNTPPVHTLEWCPWDGIMNV